MAARYKILLVLLALALAATACVITGGDICTVSEAGLYCPSSDFTGGYL
jgi:heme A synthase